MGKPSFAACALLVLWSLCAPALFALGKQEAPAAPPPPPPAEKVPTLKERFDALGPNVPALGFAPPVVEGVVPKELADRVFSDVVRSFIEGAIFRPYSIGEWFKKISAERRGTTIFDAIRRAKTENMAVRAISTVRIFKVGDSYGLRIGVFSLSDPSRPAYFLRTFRDEEEWAVQLPLLIEEIRFRSLAPPRTFSPIRFYVDSFTTNVFLGAQLQTGETQYSPSTFVNIKGTDIRETEDLFRELVGMEFHESRIAGVVIAESPTPAERASVPWDFLISGSVKVSQELNILTVRITRSGGGPEPVPYVFTFRGVGIETLRDVARKVVWVALTTSLDKRYAERLRRVDLDLSDRGSFLLSRGYFLGETSQRGMIVHSGLNWFLSVGPVLKPPPMAEGQAELAQGGAVGDAAKGATDAASAAADAAKADPAAAAKAAADAAAKVDPAAAAKAASDAAAKVDPAAIAKAASGFKFDPKAAAKAASDAAAAAKAGGAAGAAGGAPPPPTFPPLGSSNYALLVPESGDAPEAMGELEALRAQALFDTEVN